MTIVKFYFKRKTICFKNNNIVLQDYRIPQDHLWDIPIKKVTLHKDNHVTPSSYSAMYTASSEKSTITNKLSTKKIRKNISDYNHLFAPSYNLIDLNDTDNGIASQIRCDAKEFQLVNLR